MKQLTLFEIEQDNDIRKVQGSLYHWHVRETLVQGLYLGKRRLVNGCLMEILIICDEHGLYHRVLNNDIFFGD